MPQQVTDIIPAERDWYKPGPSIAAFHQSRVRTRVLVGARGSGKTTAHAVDATGHGWHNSGGKIYILRKTQESNESTTLDTYEEAFKQCGSAYVDTGLSLFKKMEGGKHFRIPSAEAVRLYNAFLLTKPNKTQLLQWLDTIGNRFCSFIHFAGVPDAGKRDTRFRGYECSMLILVEADQLTEEDYLMAICCLRWKDAHGRFIEDYSCIIDTNPPGTKHWIAVLEAESALGHRTDIQFWHIPTEENAHNLRPGYVDEIKRAYARRPALYKRMVLGQYADAFEGDPVLWAFSEEHAYDDLPWPRGAYLIRGWDFGTTQALTFAAYWEDNGDEYWWDLLEFYATGSDVERQSRRCWELTREVFPFWNDRSVCSGVFDACDPAGNARTDKGRSLDVLATHGIFPKFSTKHRSLQLTIAAYNRLLEQKDRHGRLVYRICRKGCPMLYSASLGGYRYPQVGEHGHGSNEPGKGPSFGDFDHVADASRYPKVNFLKLMNAELESLSKPVGKMAAKKSVNPPRRWR